MTQKENGTAHAASSHLDDTVKSGEEMALHGLSKDEIKRLSIDAWEPSLLRHMLEAQRKLQQR